MWMWVWYLYYNSKRPLDRSFSSDPAWSVNMSTRRSFLKSVLGGAAVMSHSVRSNGDPYWEMVRRQFPFTDERVPLNAGNLCPSPRSVSDRVAALTRSCSVERISSLATSLSTRRLVPSATAKGLETNATPRTPTSAIV